MLNAWVEDYNLESFWLCSLTFIPFQMKHKEILENRNSASLDKHWLINAESLLWLLTDTNLTSYVHAVIDKQISPLL